MKKKPRGYQKQAFEEILEAWNEHQAVVYQLSTGGGKSMIFSMLIDHFYSQKKPIYFVVHTKNLYKQASEELEEAGIYHSILAAGYPKLDTLVKVISVQSLDRRLKIGKIMEPSAVIYDEGHHSGSATYQKPMKKWKKSKFLFLTATPIGAGGVGLEKAGATKLICGPPMSWLIEQGFLSRYKYYAPEADNQPGLSGLDVINEDFVEEQLEQRVNKRHITGNAIQHYQRHGQDLPAIANCVSIQHAKDVADQFREAGYSVGCMHSEMNEDPREMLLGLKSGKYQVLTQCNMISEGTDVPLVTVMIGLRPTASVVIHLQQCGRVLRCVYAPGFDISTAAGRMAAMEAGPKPYAIILDCVGNVDRLGYPDDDREWSLEGKKKVREASTLKRCPDCLRMIAISLKECPHEDCLFDFTIKPKRSVIPEQKEGNLMEVNSKNTERDRLIELVDRWIWRAKEMEKIEDCKNLFLVIDCLEGRTERKKQAIEYLDKIKQTDDVVKIKGLIK